MLHTASVQINYWLVWPHKLIMVALMSAENTLAPPVPGSLMARVAKRIQELGYSPARAAREIGVGSNTLQRHIAGEHVRSDSARKYENWLEGRASVSNVFVLPRGPKRIELDVGPEVALPPVPAKPHLVVDIFSGCGGLSLGFDLLDSGRQFRTVLAIDNEHAPIATFNRNTAIPGYEGHPVGRVTDLTEFLNEAEFLTYYLSHAAKILNDQDLATDLSALKQGAFPAFLDDIARADRAYLERLNEIRASPAWRDAYVALDRQALLQTSVVHFHDRLALPRPSLKVATMPAILWHEQWDDRPKRQRAARAAQDEWVKLASTEWDAEVVALSSRGSAEGRGQLSASMRRVGMFTQFLDSEAMHSVRDAWVVWRGARLALRESLFGDEDFGANLRTLYNNRAPVSVLVGGPPCQGFSRIGRGKIRSLAEAAVHTQVSAEAGDARNLLFQRYVMVLGALRPKTFLFENVQHFQSVVKANGVEFQATEVLAEAISNMSDGEVRYEVASNVLDASRHGIPQARQRFFMAGVRADKDAKGAAAAAQSCLRLRREREAPLSLALAGLSQPGIVGGDARAGDVMAAQSTLDAVSADHPYLKWVRQPRPGADASPAAVDGHASRAARADDAAFFALMGPGRRWMDYRSDQAPTLIELAGLIDGLLAIEPELWDKVQQAVGSFGGVVGDRMPLEDLRRRIDGSLSLRLLLEHAGERLGSSHHLLTESYLAKREGNHGDWVARMDPSRPSKTMVSHMGKDTYAYIHPFSPRTISVREAARIQSFPDWFSFGDAALTDAFKMIGNAVPPMLSYAIATKVANVLALGRAAEAVTSNKRA